MGSITSAASSLKDQPLEAVLSPSCGTHQSPIPMQFRILDWLLSTFELALASLQDSLAVLHNKNRLVHAFGRSGGSMTQWEKWCREASFHVLV